MFNLPEGISVSVGQVLANYLPTLRDFFHGTASVASVVESGRELQMYRRPSDALGRASGRRNCWFSWFVINPYSINPSMMGYE